LWSHYDGPVLHTPCIRGIDLGLFSYIALGHTNNWGTACGHPIARIDDTEFKQIDMTSSTTLNITMEMGGDS